MRVFRTKIDYVGVQDVNCVFVFFRLFVYRISQLYVLFDLYNVLFIVLSIGTNFSANCIVEKFPNSKLLIKISVCKKRNFFLFEELSKEHVDSNNKNREFLLSHKREL